MKGLKTLVILGLVGFSFNTQALKLEIIKKSSSIAHDAIDKAEIDSISAEQNLKDELSTSQIDEDGFDTIKTVQPNRKAASKSTYTKPAKTIAQDDFKESTSKVNKINKKKLPKSDSITTDEAVRSIDSNISNEFEDEIGADEMSDEEDYYSAGI